MSAAEPRFLIVGAGMAGILAAARLQDAGFDDYVIYEKADRLGGTWRENRYRGIACDVPSHLYSYSFEPNPDWSHRFSPGAEIQAYLEDVARRRGVDQRICFGEEVARLAFEEGRWRLETQGGTRDEGDFVIAATGVLHHPAIPDIPGLSDFEGRLFHSARWEDDLSLEGQRMGVVGTGSTAIQITGAVVDEVRHLSVFQRTAQWVMPQTNDPYTEEEKAAFRRDPSLIRELRAEISRSFAEGFSNAVVDKDSPQLRLIEQACREHLEQSVRDPVLREKLRPSYRAACKRLVISGEFYDAIQRPNAELVTEPIERVEKTGVRTSDGVLHELDVLVLATGFRADRFLRPIHVVGRSGVTLDEVWKRRPTAYLSVTIPDFPNLFLLNGPNGPVGNFSLIEVAELQFDYVLKLVEQVRSGSFRELAARREALERFDADRIEAAKHTIWYSGCRSWYLDEEGIPAAWPWTFDRFRDAMAEPVWDDFELR